MFLFFFFFFFFQAEDGIRDGTVTGVQTCALPISRGRRASRVRPPAPRRGGWVGRRGGSPRRAGPPPTPGPRRRRRGRGGGARARRRPRSGGRWWRPPGRGGDRKSVV